MLSTATWQQAGHEQAADRQVGDEAEDDRVDAGRAGGTGTEPTAAASAIFEPEMPEGDVDARAIIGARAGQPDGFPKQFGG